MSLAPPKKGFVIPRKSGTPPPASLPDSPTSTASNLSERQKEILKQQHYKNTNNFTEVMKKEKGLRNTINYVEQEENWAKTFGKNNALRSNLFTNNSSVWSPKRLNKALNEGNIKTVEEYIKHGYNMTKPVEDESIEYPVYPMTYALSHGDTEMLKLLLSAGVPYHHSDDNDIEAWIQYAKNKKWTEILTILEGIKKDRNTLSSIEEKFDKEGDFFTIFQTLPKNEQALLFRRFEDLVREGDAKAMVAFADFYVVGMPVKKNIRKAYDLIKKAAEKENPEAMYILASILNKEYDTMNVGEQFRTPLRIPPNKEEATRLIKLAAKKGNKLAKNVERKFIPVTNNNMNELANMFSKMSVKGGRKTRRTNRKTKTRKH